MIATLTTNRWWVYQQERFPIAAHGLLIAAFSFSGVCLSTMLRGADTFPPAASILTAFAVAFGFFLLLRIADEFKDYEEDARYRPYRPVPRGLVKLRELGWIGAAVMALQLVLTLALQPRLVLLLALAWAYWGLMCVEFFVPNWLRRKHFTYMWSHMLIMPLFDLYITGCDWLVNTTPANAPAYHAPAGLGWFLLTSFFNGIVLEIGRKIRQPQDEETGVDTYSRVWGRPKAVALWVLALLLTAGCAFMTAVSIHFQWAIAAIFGALLAYVAYLIREFFATGESHWGKQFESVAGAWTALMYLCLGTLPLVLSLTGVL